MNMSNFSYIFAFILLSSAGAEARSIQCAFKDNQGKVTYSLSALANKRPSGTGPRLNDVFEKIAIFDSNASVIAEDDSAQEPLPYNPRKRSECMDAYGIWYWTEVIDERTGAYFNLGLQPLYERFDIGRVFSAKLQIGRHPAVCHQRFAPIVVGECIYAK